MTEQTTAKAPALWACRIIVRQAHPQAQTYPSRNGCEVRLAPDERPIARGAARDEAWLRAWEALQQPADEQMESGR